jgi:hypothetical protein
MKYIYFHIFYINNNNKIELLYKKLTLNSVNCKNRILRVIYSYLKLYKYVNMQNQKL